MALNSGRSPSAATWDRVDADQLLAHQPDRADRDAETVEQAAHGGQRSDATRVAKQVKGAAGEQNQRSPVDHLVGGSPGFDLDRQVGQERNGVHQPLPSSGLRMSLRLSPIGLIASAARKMARPTVDRATLRSLGSGR